MTNEKVVNYTYNADETITVRPLDGKPYEWAAFKATVGKRGVVWQQPAPPATDDVAYERQPLPAAPTPFLDNDWKMWVLAGALFLVISGLLQAGYYLIMGEFLTLS